MKQVIEELYKEKQNEIDFEKLIMALVNKKVDLDTMYRNIKQDTE